jgi:hypothetical protein
MQAAIAHVVQVCTLKLFSVLSSESTITITAGNGNVCVSDLPAMMAGRSLTHNRMAMGSSLRYDE